MAHVLQRAGGEIDVPVAEVLVDARRLGLDIGDLATALGRSENAVSQALRVLRRQGWVTSTRVGRLVSYRLEDHIVHDLLHWIGAAHAEPDAVN